MSAEAVEIVCGGATTGREGDAVVEIGELGRTVAAGELAGAIAQSNEAIDGRAGCVGV